MLKSLFTYLESKTKSNVLSKDRICFSDQAVGWTIRGSNPGGGGEEMVFFSTVSRPNKGHSQLPTQ